MKEKTMKIIDITIIVVISISMIIFIILAFNAANAVKDVAEHQNKIIKSMASEPQIRFSFPNESYEILFKHSKDGISYSYFDKRNGSISKYKRTCKQIRCDCMDWGCMLYCMECNETEIKE